MTIGFHTQHFRLGKFIFELVVIFKFEAENHTLSMNCKIPGTQSIPEVSIKSKCDIVKVKSHKVFHTGSINKKLIDFFG